MRNDLIHQISGLKDITHAVVLTHNIDFVFLQTVFLSALRQCGHPGLTLFADAQCAEESYRYQSSMLSGLGERYRVVPVSMEYGYRFHPKAILLSGSEGATLFVGSGNMTFGGMRDNAEIWQRFDTSNGEYTAIAAFEKYLTSIADRVILSDAIKLDLRELFDEKNHKWVALLDEPSDLLGRPGHSESLLDQVMTQVNNRHVTKLTICAPYYDPEGEALVELSSALGNPVTEVLLQSRRSTLIREVASKLPSHISLVSVGFRDESDEVEESRRFIHAKIFGIEFGETVLVVGGSANCSRAALLSKGRRGNAELVSYQEMTRAEFESSFLNELVRLEGKPELLENDDILVDEDEPLPHIRIMGASYDINQIRVGFSSTNNVQITKCLINSDSVPYELSESGEVNIKYQGSPHTVKLLGVLNGDEVTSNTMWIDNESKLHASAKGRALIDKISRSSSSSAMEVEDWTIFVELFAKDLDYVTAKEMRNSEQVKHDDSTDIAIASRADVFSDSYDRSSVLPQHALVEIQGKSFSIYNLLLNAFCTNDAVPSEQESVDQDNDIYQESDDDESLDRPTDFNMSSSEQGSSKPEKEMTERQKKRVSKVAESIADALTNHEFLEHRDPKRLGIDLQLAGLLLRNGYSKDWLDEQQFFDITQRIWSALFFSYKSKKNIGWIELRLRRAEDKNDFVESFSSPGLAATLLSWAIAIPTNIDGLLMQRFRLSLVLGMGRLPFIWCSDNEGEEIAHLLKIISASPCGDMSGLDIEKVSKIVQARRIEWLRQGAALVAMECALDKTGLSVVRDSINNKAVTRGDILWQGNLGTCIATDDSSDYSEYVEVICLQEPTGSKKFKKDFINPLSQLAGSELLKQDEGYTDKHFVALSELINELKLQRSPGSLTGVNT